MKLSVVVPTCNRREILAGTLPTLFAQEFPAEAYEIIVVVDGSTDGSLEWLHSLRPPRQLRILSQDNRGPAAARNAAVKAAVGEIVLFLDDDLICDPNLLSAHIAAHRGEKPTLVFGRMRGILGQSPNSEERWMWENLERYYERLEKDPRPKWPDDAWAGPNCSIPRAVFLEASGYDERLFPRRGEDTELGLRLWKMGVNFLFNPKAITSHRWVKSNRQTWVDDVTTGASTVRICKRHREYRPHSGLSGITRGPAWRRLCVRVASGRPVATGLLLGAPLAVLAKAKPSWTQAVGRRLVLVRQAVAMAAGARMELGSWQALRQEFGISMPVLLYHHVGPARPGTYPELTVPPRAFERQMAWLAARGYVGIRPSDWLAWRQEGKPLPPKPVLLTFDDGYADLAEYAFPVLKRHGFSGAVFIVTGQVGCSNAWDEACGSGTHRLLTADEIRKWAGQGIEFGAHSRTHRDLTALPAEELEREVAGSQGELAQILRGPVTSFAYPYGTFNGRVREQVATGYGLAFSTREGLNDLRADPYTLCRTMVQPEDSLLDFASRLRWGWSPMLRFRARLARIWRRSAGREN